MTGTCMTIYSVAHKDPCRLSIRTMVSQHQILYLWLHSSKTTQKTCSVLRSECQFKLISLTSAFINFISVSQDWSTQELIWIPDVFPGQTSCSNRWTLHRISFFIPLAPLCFSEQLPGDVFLLAAWGWARQGRAAMGMLRCCPGGGETLSWQGRAGSTCT